MKDLRDVFEEAIARRELQILVNAHKFEDEEFEEFYAKIANRIMRVVVTFRARDLAAIDSVCVGLDAEWQGFYIQRRRVDQLDNIYVSRLRE